LGSEHPDTLNSMHHLMSVLRKQGKNTEAEQVQQQILKFRKENS